MLDRIPAFTFSVDLPVSALTLAGFMLYFRIWAHEQAESTGVDLVKRLPTACLYVTCLIAAITLACWLANIAVWSIFVLLLLVGAVLSLFVQADITDGGFALLVAGGFIREWAFGFPSLILRPPEYEPPNGIDANVVDELVGASGVTTSPLRPQGEAEFEGRVLTVQTYNGQFLDSGTNVTVTGLREGLACVRAVTNDPDPTNEMSHE